MLKERRHRIRPIPAGAGEPQAAPVPEGTQKAYPRGCGGASICSKKCGLLSGLSPRVRGSLSDRRAAFPPRRPIPAGAGEPRRSTARSSTRAAYPRGCGGAFGSNLRSSVTTGLSPRVRGSPRCPSRPSARSRPIPAGAGEPLRKRARARRARAYPRGCGGAEDRARSAGASCGLSPRVRGSQYQTDAITAYKRPIPAGAGEPVIPQYRSEAHEAYPRGCGGAYEQKRVSHVGGGLSPRVRGSPARVARRPVELRPIPAGAGEPARRPRPAPPPTAYPRGCGGATQIARATRSISGLSPRVRGSHRHDMSEVADFRPIPAGAGEPSTSSSPVDALAAYPRGCGGATL